MNRKEMTQALASAGFNFSTLRRMGNDELQKFYKKHRHTLVARARDIEKSKRYHQKLEAMRAEEREEIEKVRREITLELMEMQRQADWATRCYNRYLTVKPIKSDWVDPSKPVLDFGLAAFVGYARMQFVRFGDQDAAATLRILRAS